MFDDNRSDPDSALSKKKKRIMIYFIEAAEKLIEEEGVVKPDKKEVTVQVLVRTHQSFIAEAYGLKSDLDVERHKGRFMELFDYIMKAAG